MGDEQVDLSGSDGCLLFWVSLILFQVVLMILAGYGLWRLFHG